MPLKVLVAYSMETSHISTTEDYLWALKRHTAFDVSYVHVTHEAALSFDINAFDVVLQNYCARLCFDGHVSESYLNALRDFTGLKLLAVQDEYDRTNVLKQAIRDLGFHVVLTCVPQGSIEAVYPQREFPNVEFVSVFSGYVPDEAPASANPPSLEDRPIVIGYRGRDIGGRYGLLAYEKYEMGRRFKEICESRGITSDIAVDEQSRIYGPAWFDFIGSCRVMLGTESGSNVFDFDGTLERQYREMSVERGGKIGYEEFLPIVSSLERKIPMAQVSPRIFECTIMRTPMILFRGGYSGIIEPDKHYIPLEKDFSNINSVLARAQCLHDLEAIANRAYDDLIVSDRYSYRTYANQLASLIVRKTDELRSSRNWLRTSGATSAKRSIERHSNTDTVLSNHPTERPLERKYFDLSQEVIAWTKTVAIRKHELGRLIHVFDDTCKGYRAEVAKLLLRSGGDPDAACGQTAAVALGQLDSYVTNCLEGHAKYQSGWTVLWERARRARELGVLTHELREIHWKLMGTTEEWILLLNDAITIVGLHQTRVVLEPEVARLIRVFDEASTTYQAEMARLNDVIAAESRQLSRNGMPGRTVPEQQVAVMSAAVEDFSRHCRKCRDRHSSLRSQLVDLKRSVENDRVAAKSDFELRDTEQRSVEFLQNEIKTLNSEIDALNAFAQKAIALINNNHGDRRLNGIEKFRMLATNAALFGIPAAAAVWFRSKHLWRTPFR